MDSHRGMAIEISKPSLEDEDWKQICYTLKLKINDYNQEKFSAGVLKSPLFYLGINNECEANILVHTKGRCLKNCERRQGSSSGICVALQFINKCYIRGIICGCEVRIDDNGYLPRGRFHSSSLDASLEDSSIPVSNSKFALTKCSIPIFVHSNEKIINFTFNLKLQAKVVLDCLPTTDAENANTNVINNGIEKSLWDMQQDAELTDTALVADGGECKAHKVVLAARSPVFKAMFLLEMSESRTNVVELSDMNCETLQSLVEYMYTGSAPNMDGLGEALLSAADKYQLEELMVKCEEALSNQLSVENAARIFLLAALHRADSLKAKVVSFIKSNKEEVFATREWKTVIENHSMSVINAFI